LNTESLPVLRLMSILAHSVLGANAAATAGRHPLEGVPAAIVVEALPHTPFSNGIAGGAAVTAAYVPFALGGFSLQGLIDWWKKAFPNIPPPLGVEELLKAHAAEPRGKGAPSLGSPLRPLPPSKGLPSRGGRGNVGNEGQSLDWSKLFGMRGVLRGGR